MHPSASQPYGITRKPSIRDCPHAADASQPAPFVRLAILLSKTCNPLPDPLNLPPRCRTLAACGAEVPCAQSVAGLCVLLDHTAILRFFFELCKRFLLVHMVLCLTLALRVLREANTKPGVPRPRGGVWSTRAWSGEKSVFRRVCINQNRKIVIQFRIAMAKYRATHNCLRCKYIWKARVEGRPRQCPHCRQIRWDEPPRPRGRPRKDNGQGAVPEVAENTEVVAPENLGVEDIFGV